MLRVKRHYLDETINNFITNKMTIDLDMFGPLTKKKKIKSKMNDNLVITKQKYRNLKVLQQLA